MRIRKLRCCVAVAGWALLIAPALAAEYRVVLRDGSWLRSSEPPRIVDRSVRVRIEGGLLAVLDSDRIDWDRTTAWNRRAQRNARAAPAAALAPAPGTPPGTVTIIGDPAARPARPPAASEGSPPDEPSSAEAPPDAPADPAAGAAADDTPAVVLRRRLDALEGEIQVLGERRQALEGRIRRAVYLDRLPDLERQLEDLTRQLEGKRAEHAALLRRYAAKVRR